MELYESVFIARQDISSMELEKIIDKYIKLIEDDGGKLINKENWGLRNLAYKIKNNRKGNYVLMNIESKGTTIKELERVFRIDEDIIRFLNIKVKSFSEEPSIIMKQQIEKENSNSEH